MRNINEYYKLKESSSKAMTPDEHRKNIINDVTPEVTKASVQVADYLEANGDDEKLQRKWLSLTGDAQIALLDMVDFIKKNIT